LQLARQLTSLMQHAEENRDAFERGAAGERRRIAQDLHDDVGARLLSGLHKPDLAQIRETLRESLADMRSIVSGLSGERLPLDQVVGDLRHETAQRFEIANISLDWPLTDDFEKKILLDYQVYRNLRSILREIVSNIIRHSDATHVSISMFLHGEALHVSVSDNGRGFDASAPQNGNGISNMQSRINGLGGSCSFPVVERGTRIEISLPLQAWSQRPVHHE
jgi:signal transduction histidine kinase